QCFYFLRRSLGIRRDSTSSSMVGTSTWIAPSPKPERGSAPIVSSIEASSEADKEAEVRLGRADPSRDREVVLQKIGGEVHQLPEAHAHAEMAAREVILDAKGVVVGC